MAGVVSPSCYCCHSQEQPQEQPSYCFVVAWKANAMGEGFGSLAVVHDCVEFDGMCRIISPESLYPFSVMMSSCRRLIFAVCLACDSCSSTAWISFMNLSFAACLVLSLFISKSRFRHSGDAAYRRASSEFETS